MFTIVGGDGKEYGPVSTEQVRVWIAAGRANLRTQARAAGSEEWRTLGDFAEFGGPEAGPPVLPGAAPATIGAAVAATAQPLLDRGSRTGAALINAAFYFFCIMPASVAMSRRLVAQNPDLARGGFPRIDSIDLSGFREGLTWVWIGLLSAMFVQCLLLGFRGQNLGKLLVGGRVVRVDGSRAGFLRAAVLRFMLPVMFIMFLNIIFPLGFFFLAVDYGFMFRADGRCLHDLIAGTKVVRA